MLHMPTLDTAAEATSPPALPAPVVPTAPVAPTWAGHEILDDPITAGVLLSVWSGDPAVLVPAPPGSGKSRLVVLLAATLAHRAGLRVGIAAQTRAQATELALRFNRLPYPAALRWGNTGQPDLGPGPVRIVKGHTGFTGSGGGISIATTARWLLSDPNADTCDVMIVDEAWQATYADLAALGAFAAQLVAVGDPGQIDPVVTGSTARWADEPTGPHLPSPTALTAAHPDGLSIVKLRHTYRLGPATTGLIQPIFYPDLPFTSRRPDEQLILPTRPLPELAHASVPAPNGPTDPNLALACATLARELLTATYTNPDGTRPMTGKDVAIVTPHVNQAATVRAMLPDHPDVLIGTANSLQGLERAAVIALHPLAGYRDPTDFGCDLGRACVMLSRHRAHLTVVTDPATAQTLDTATTPEAQLHANLLDTITATPTR